MQTHARAERFEEAAWCRDRARALARSLRRRRAWQALQRAGTIRAESADGDGALIHAGLLLAAWRRQAPPLAMPPPPSDEPPPVPPSVAAADEAHLVWRWLASDGVEIVDAAGPLSLPVCRVPAVEDLVA